jgi:starch synthase
VVYSVYDDEFDTPLRKEFKDKLKIEGINNKAIKKIKDNPNYVNLTSMALDNSDAVIKGSPEISGEIEEYIKNLNKPTLEYQPEDKYLDAYSEFYDELLTK